MTHICLLAAVQDGRWTYSIDHNTVQDGDNVNNWLAVEWRDGMPEVSTSCPGKRVACLRGPLIGHNAI